MAIIKAHHAGNMIKEAIVLDLGDLSRQGTRLRQAAEEKAQAILQDAQKRANHLLMEAQKQVESAHGHGLEEGRIQGLEEGRAHGLEEGREQGRQEALAEMKQRLETLEKGWQAALTAWDKQRQENQRDARRVVLEMALAVSRKVVHRIVEVDPTVIEDQLASALGYVLRPLDITVKLNPDDQPIVQQAMPSLLNEMPQLKSVKLQPDPCVARGGCVLTYGQGRIDATLDMQLDRIVRLLLPDAQPSTPAASADGQTALKDDVGNNPGSLPEDRQEDPLGGGNAD